MATLLALLLVFLSRLFSDQLGNWDSLVGLILQLPGWAGLAAVRAVTDWMRLAESTRGFCFATPTPKLY